MTCDEGEKVSVGLEGKVRIGVTVRVTVGSDTHDHTHTHTHFDHAHIHTHTLLNPNHDTHGHDTTHTHFTPFGFEGEVLASGPTCWLGGRGVGPRARCWLRGHGDLGWSIGLKVRVRVRSGERGKWGARGTCWLGGRRVDWEGDLLALSAKCWIRGQHVGLGVLASRAW